MTHTRTVPHAVAAVDEDPINTASPSLGGASSGGAAGGAGAAIDEVAAVAREIMTVEVRQLSGAVFVIPKVSIDMKARDLKKLIEDKMGFAPRFLVLYGEKLVMDKSLKQQGCTPGDYKTIQPITVYGKPCSACNPDNTHAHHCIHE